jgi:hypothetical protein
MNVLHRTIAADIHSALGRSSETAEAKLIATLCLTETITFITQLLSTADALYERLHTFSKFTSDQAWSSTTQVLERIVSDLYAPKSGVVESLSTGSPLSTYAHVMWASFRCQDVMMDYVDHCF